jgi:hypothetical protein
LTFEHHQDIETLNGNSKVWRYIALDKFADLLLNQRLFFTRIDKLPDRYERELPPGVIASRRTLLKRQGVDSDQIVNELQTFRERHEARLRECLVNCWTVDREESYALWKIYLGGSAAGVAIRTSFSKLKRAILSRNKRDERALYGGVVRYDYYRPSGEPTIFRLLTTKREYYKYEKELRLFLLDPPSISSNDAELRLGSQKPYLEVDIQSLIEDIYVSPFAGQWFVDTVSQLVGSLQSTLNARIQESRIIED